MDNDTPYHQYLSQLQSELVVIPHNANLIGRNCPFWKVSIVPDRKEPESRFSLVVSMSRLGGDARTYYNLYRMLDSRIDVRNIPSLNPVRSNSYRPALADLVGEDDVVALQRTLEIPTNIPDNKPDWQKFFDQWMERQKQEIQKSLKSLDPTVMKLFYIDEHWLRMATGSTTEIDEDIDPTLKHEVSIQPQTSPISTTSALSSWFFRITNASIGFITADVRHHLPLAIVHELLHSHEENDNALEETNPFLSAGNYIHCISCIPEDYAHPGKCNKASHGNCHN
jgi:hypothetical protein